MSRYPEMIPLRFLSSGAIQVARSIVGLVASSPKLSGVPGTASKK